MLAKWLGEAGFGLVRINGVGCDWLRLGEVSRRCMKLLSLWKVK